MVIFHGVTGNNRDRLATDSARVAITDEKREKASVMVGDRFSEQLAGDNNGTLRSNVACARS